ncbi:MAG: prepilin-type N-terminal cleavage/methylation domain-containing protein [Candidatus Magnetoovum sp. WYHC-5]|nr:prepilin-type N-terminal cleavage/methylation domain-containing protein [Candidatus Magnetoovum sp. WYHC-5]
MKGFTLIEVVIAVLLFAVIAFAVYNTFFMVNRAITQTDDYVIRLQELRETLDAIKKEVESAYYVGHTESTVFKVIDTDVYGKQVSSLSAATFAGPGSSLKRVTYYVDGTEELLALFKEVQPSIFKDMGSIKVSVIDNIKEFDVRVYVGENSMRNWDSTETKKLPQKVLIKITVPFNHSEIEFVETIYTKIK